MKDIQNSDPAIHNYLLSLYAVEVIVYPLDHG